MRAFVKQVRKRGFALILTISLLAFLVVLLVALASLTRVETRIGRNNLQYAQAKQNALNALHIALGELQRAAGPDQRVTARADILGSSITNPYWTGVWNTSDGSLVTWLVSGNAGNTTAQTPDAGVTNGVDLVGKNTDGNPNDVVVPEMDLRGPAPDGTQNTLLGHYAYWVGDEGAKASAGVTGDMSTLTYIPFGESGVRRGISFSVPQRFGIETVSPDVDANDPDWGRVISFSQISLPQTASSSSQISRPEARSHFFDLTPMAEGVLTSTVTGGLRYDLSQGSLSAFPGIADYQSLTAASYQDSAGDRAYLNLTKADTGPLLTDFRLSIGFHVDGSGHPVWSVQTVAELWNPYNAMLTEGESADGSEIAPRFRLVVRPLPGASTGDPADNFTYTATGADTSADYSQDLNELFSGLSDYPGVGSTGDQNILSFDTSAALPEPGEIQVFKSDTTQGPWALTRGQTTSGSVTAFSDSATTMPATAGSAGSVTFNTFTPSANLAVDLYPLIPGASGAAPIEKLIRSYPLAVTPEKVTEADWTQTLYFNFGFQMDETGIGIDADPRDLNVKLDPITYEPADEAEAYPDDPGNTGDGKFGQSNTLSRWVLFDVPQTEVLSLGQLAQAHLSGMGPLAVGYPGQNAINDVLWDSDFFSSVPGSFSSANYTTAGIRLPNTRYRIYRSGSDSTYGNLKNPNTAAGNLLVAGSFNINSTSVTAWTALLRGASQQSISVYDPLTQGSETVGPIWSGSGRFSQCPGYTYFDLTDTTGSGGVPVVRSIWQTGFRQLTPLIAQPKAGSTELSYSAADSDALARGLAYQIVAAIRKNYASNGSPYLGLRDFIESGAISTAIDSVAYPPVIDSKNDTAPFNPDPLLLPAAPPISGLNQSYDGNTWKKILPKAPAYLRQSDLLTAIAPFISARSDTFRIRSYGDAVNPVTGAVEARAWCEAIVQRVPDYVDSSQAPDTAVSSLNPENAAFGRRFKIVYFRWMSSDDL